MDFEFSDAIPRYWAYNDPFMTHFVGALSTFFPDGERFFIDSVRHFAIPSKTTKFANKRLRALLAKKRITPKSMNHSIISWRNVVYLHCQAQTRH
jgi:hypothetical protein